MSLDTRGEAMSIFNTNAYNTAIWYGAKMFSLGQLTLGHDPRLARLITHDPYCPCGIQGLVERNFKKAAALFGAVCLPLTYWKWKKSDLVVVGFFALFFYVAIREIYEATQTEFHNDRVKKFFPEDGVTLELPEDPVVHKHRRPGPAHRIQADGNPEEDQPANSALAGCDKTMDRAVLEKHLANNNTGCAHCRADVRTGDIVIHFAALAMMFRIRANQDLLGKPLNTQSFADVVGTHYNLGNPKEQRSMIIHDKDGHTYPAEDYLAVLNRGRSEDNKIRAKDCIENKWLAELFEKIEAQRATSP